MNWYILASEIWHPRPESAIVLAVVYLVPILRLITFPVSFGGRYFMKLNRISGLWEEIISPIRNTIVLVYLLGGIAWNVSMATEIHSYRYPLAALVSASLIGLGFANARWKHKAYIDLMNFLERSPTIHPQEFFDHLLCSEGAIRHRLPAEPYKTIDPANADFTKRNKQSYVRLSTLAVGLWSSIRLARLAMLVHRHPGHDALKKVSLSLATVWAMRIAQLINAKITIDGIDNVPRIPAHLIYLYTHKSFLDFVLAPLIPIALTAKFGPEKRLPLFLLAMDHFKRNILFYRLIGIGRVAEALDMLFVKRSDEGSRERASNIARDAAQKVMSENADLAIFPQGTRAYPYPRQSGEPYDAGYYTVGSKRRMAADGRHLKKGAAFIATEIAERMSSENDSTYALLIPVSIGGTTIACPRGSMKIRSGVPMRLSIGGPLVLTKSSAEEFCKKKGPGLEVGRMVFANNIHARIDHALRATTKIHAELERRFFKDINDMLGPLQMDEMAVAMKPWRGDDYLVHAIIDCIYTCPPMMWRQMLGELIHNILNFAERDDFLKLKAKIVGHIQGIS